MWSLFKLNLWACVWMIVWIIVKPFMKNKHNCLTWAIQQWDRHGGYLALRWGRTARFKWLVWPHFMWIPPYHHDIVQHYIPLKDPDTVKVLPAPYFKGRAVIGDREDEVFEN